MPAGKLLQFGNKLKFPLAFPRKRVYNANRGNIKERQAASVLPRADPVLSDIPTQRTGIKNLMHQLQLTHQNMSRTAELLYAMAVPFCKFSTEQAAVSLHAPGNFGAFHIAAESAVAGQYPYSKSRPGNRASVHIVRESIWRSGTDT